MFRGKPKYLHAHEKSRASPLWVPFREQFSKQKSLHQALHSANFAFPDLYGRLIGKRFDADFFWSFTFANWVRGYGDFLLRPNFSSLLIAIFCYLAIRSPRTTEISRITSNLQLSPFPRAGKRA